MKQWTAEEKFRIVKEVLTTDSSVSAVCKKYQIGASQFYAWQNQFFDSAKNGLERKKNGGDKSEQRRIERLEAENTRMKDVIAEITAENVAFKKKNWD